MHKIKHFHAPDVSASCTHLQEEFHRPIILGHTNHPPLFVRDIFIVNRQSVTLLTFPS